MTDYYLAAKRFVRDSGFTPDHPDWFDKVALARRVLMYLDCIPQTTELDKR